MRRLLVMVLFVLSGPVTRAAADEVKPTVLSSQIRKVTVYSDRASVTRTAAVKITTEPTVYAFKKLPGWVDDGSVRVSLSPAKTGRIVDVRVKRDYLARATDEKHRQVEGKVKQIMAQMSELDDELKVLDAQKKHIEAINVFSLQRISKDAALGAINVETYRLMVKFISEALRETAKARRAVQQKRTELTPELQVQQRRLQELQSLTQLEETAVLVTLEGATSSDATLALTYLLPGATWEPTHELRARGSNPESAEVTSFAIVTQTSGEDWENVDISFSTQSSTESIRIPELEALTLGDTQVATRIMRSRTSSFSRAEAAFKGQSRMWNKKMQKSAYRSNFQQVYETNLNYLQVVQSKTVEIFRSLQKRGTTAHFGGRGKQTIRGDGRSVRVRIGHGNLKAQQQIVAAPELSLNAARTLEMTNSSAQPFLPGKVALYQDGTFLGMTDTNFVAEGEKFAVFLSVADQIKLSRVLDRKHSALIRRKKTRMRVAFEVSVENLSDEAVAVNLADRVPVSENREIRVDNVKVSPTGKPDSKGLLHWSLNLQPREKKTFRIQYRVEYPPSLILSMERARKQRARMRKRAQKGGMASPAAQQPDEDLSQQIMRLEEAF